MASKANNVLIHLKAIGADATARGIDKVRDSLNDLNKARRESNDIDATADQRNKDLTKSTRSLNNALKRQNAMLDGLRGNQKEYVDNIGKMTTLADKQTTRHLKNQKRMMQIDAMAKAESRRRTREIVANEKVIQREKDRTARLEAKRLKDAARLEAKRLKDEDAMYARHARKRSKLRQELTVLPSFRRPLRVALIASITTLVADAISFVGTGLNALAAGAIAGVNGLAPLAGMLVTLPAGFAAMAQSIAPATWGIKNFIAAWKGDADSLKGAGKNTLALAKALKDVRPEYKKLKKAVGERFIKDFDESFGNLAQKSLPMLNKRLRGTAAAFNGVLNRAFKWAATSRGHSIIDTVMGTSNAMLRGGLGGAYNLVKGILGLVNAASPMLKLMSKEFNAWTGGIKDQIFGNQKGLTKFFDGSYKRFKGVTSTLGDFGTGLYRLFKQSTPLTNHMGKNIKKAADDFLKWTGSKGGKKSMRKYFTDMIPKLDAVVRLAGDLGKTLFRVSNSPNFIKNIEEIRTGLLPALEKIIKAADGKFIPNLVKFAESLAKMADSGLIDALADVGSKLADAFDWVATKFAGLDPNTQKWIVFGVTVIGLFGGIATAILGVIAKVLQLIGLLGKTRLAGKIGGFLFGGGGGGALRPKGGKGGGGRGGGGSRGGGFFGGGGGGKGSKKGKPTGSARANGGNNKNDPRTKSPKPKGATRRKVAAGGAAATGGALAFLAAGPAADQIDGVQAAMSDVEFKANSLMTTGRSLDGLFGDMAQGNMQTFNGALQQVANPTTYMKFEQGVAGVGGAILGATPPLEVAKAKFEGIDTALTNMPAGQAAEQFGKIRTQATQLGIPMDKLVAQFPQYRDSLSGTMSASDKAAGGMSNATVAANKMSGVVTKAGGALNDIDTMVKPTISVQSNAPQKGSEAKTAMKVPPSHPQIDVGTNAAAVASSARSAMQIPDTHARILVQKVLIGTGKSRMSGASAGDGKSKNSFMGNDLGVGQHSWVGERGPEIGITRSGSMMLLGATGTEWFNPSERTAVIPHGASVDPFGGNYGNAPEWAKRTLQGAVAGVQTGVSGGQPNVYAPNVKVEVTNPAATVDVERAVVQAMTKMARDREARR